MLEWIDTHAHLSSDRFDNDREAVIIRAGRAGIHTIIDIGTDLDSSRAAAGLSRIFAPVYAAAGIHPHEAAACGPDQLHDLAMLLTLPKTVAAGEIGLDYHYDYSPRPLQQQLFREQLLLALDHKKPVIIHVREAMKDALEIIDSFRQPRWQGVFHCFGGSAAEAVAVIERGFHISFTGVVTFKNFNTIEAVRAVPAEKLMLETDCPYMAPVPWRGKRCEPAHLPKTGEAVAKMRETAPAELAAVTTANALRLFGLSGS